MDPKLGKEGLDFWKTVSQRAGIPLLARPSKGGDGKKRACSAIKRVSATVSREVLMGFK